MIQLSVVLVTVTNRVKLLDLHMDNKMYNSNISHAYQNAELDTVNKTVFPQGQSLTLTLTLGNFRQWINTTCQKL